MQASNEKWSVFPISILVGIFSALDRSSLAASTVVCRAWTIHAKRLLWKVVDGQVFEGLGEMCRYTQGRRIDRLWSFESTPTPSDWDVFLRNTALVHHLTLPCARGRIPLSDKLFHDIARTRPSIEIFPKLQSLTCDLVSLDPTFMSKSVVELCLTINVDAATQSDRWKANMLSLFSTIHRRMPNIRRICILDDPKRPAFSKPIEALVGGLPNLTSFERPAELLCPSIMRPFLNHRSLERLDVRCDHSTVTQLQIDVQKDPGDFNIPEGSLPSLNSIGLNSLTVSPVISLLNHVNFPSWRLIDLWINLLATEETSATYIQQLIRAVSSSCTSLERLIIRFSLSPGQAKEDAIERYQALRLCDIKDFLDVKRLKVFSIEHLFPLALTMEDITYIASRSDHLHTLWLNPKPYYIVDSGIPLDAVIVFADKCPRMKRLGLFLDVSMPSSNNYSKYFEDIEELFVGNSPLPEFSDEDRCHEHLMRCARLLSAVLSQRCIISSAAVAGDGISDSFRRRALTKFTQEGATGGDGWRVVRATVLLFTLENAKLKREMREINAVLAQYS